MKKIHLAIGAVLLSCTIAIGVYILLKFGHASAGKNSALLVIDVQNSLFPIYRQEQVISNIQLLIKKANLAQVPVIYIQQTNNVKGDAFFKGSNGWQIHESIRPQGDYISVLKENPDSFEKTDLSKILTARQIKTLVITGCATDACVAYTVRGAKALGYHVIIALDSHSTDTVANEKTIDIFNHVWSMDKSLTLAKASAITF